MIATIIISILITSAVCFWAGYKIGIHQKKKLIRNIHDSFNARYYYTSTNSEDNIEGIINFEYDLSNWKMNNSFPGKDMGSYSDFIPKDSKQIIEEKMNKALSIEDYEKAAEYRDLLKSLNKPSNTK